MCTISFNINKTLYFTDNIFMFHIIHGKDNVFFLRSFACHCDALLSFPAEIMCIKFGQHVLGITNRLPSLIWHGPHRKRRIQKFFYCCVFAAVTCFLSHCLTTIRGYVHTDWWEWFMEYTPLRWAQVPLYTYQVPVRLVQPFKNWYSQTI
jgi:hypothetical protein